MATSTFTLVPSEGIYVHVSAEEVSASGVRPGDPAVVEATVRPCTMQEWIAHGAGLTFQTEEEESDYFARVPVPGEVPLAEPDASAPEPHAEPTDHAPEPVGDDGADDYPRIRWSSAAVGV